MKQRPQPTSNPSLTRYALTGGALGLYFGWFFRPGEDQAFRLSTILFLAILIAIVYTGFFAWRQRPSFSALPFRFITTFVKAAIILAVLELRNPIYDAGGKTAVIIFTVIMGVLSGLWFAYEQSRQTRPSNKKQT